MSVHERILQGTLVWKKVAWVTTFFIVCILLAYLFFLHTNRGSSIALYMVGGWHAPVSIRFACAQETNDRVHTKFQLPLDFDKGTKDALRGFWYYDYYRECLFRNGFTFKGTPIPPSTTVTFGTTTEYVNTYGGFSFVVPGKAHSTEDNILNVDFDTSLHVSTLVLEHATISIETFLKHDYFKSFGDIVETYAEHSLAHTQVIRSESMVNSKGVPVLIVDEGEQTPSFIFITQQGHIIRVRGTDLDAETQHMILNTLQLLNVT